MADFEDASARCRECGVPVGRGDASAIESSLQADVCKRCQAINENILKQMFTKLLEKNRTLADEGAE